MAASVTLNYFELFNFNLAHHFFQYPFILIIFLQFKGKLACRRETLFTIFLLFYSI